MLAAPMVNDGGDDEEEFDGQGVETALISSRESYHL